jgi:hypothetical protein
LKFKPFKLNAIVDKPKEVNQINYVQNKALIYSRKLEIKFAALHFCKVQTISLSHTKKM